MFRCIYRWFLLGLLTFSVVFSHGLNPGAGNPETQHPLLRKAQSSYEARDYGAAIHQCSAAIQQLQSEQSVELIPAYALLGSAYVRSGHFSEGYEALQKGLDVAGRLGSAATDMVDDIYYQLGVYYDRLGHPDESKSFHQKALDHRLQEAGDNDLAIAESYFGMGELYLYTILDYRKANALFEECLRILEPILNENDLRFYFAHFNLAQVSRFLGDHEKALTHGYKSLAVIQSDAKYKPYLEQCYSLLADIHNTKTDFARAIEYYQLGIAESVRRDGRNNHTLIRKYTNLGVAHSESGQPAQAIACFKKSLLIAELSHSHSAYTAENFLHMGRTYQKEGELDSALFFLRQYVARQVAEHGSTHPATSMAYQYLAKFFQHTKQFDSASTNIQRALVSALPQFHERSIYANPPFDMVREHHRMFLLFADKGAILLNRYLWETHDHADLETGLASFRVADSLMQSSRISYEFEGSKLFFADHYHNIYEDALETCYLMFQTTKDNRYIQEAFMFMEKSKSFLLSEALHKAEHFSNAGVPESLRERERKLNATLAAYRSRLEEYSGRSVSAEDREEVQSMIFAATQKRKLLIDTIALLYPNYFQVKYQHLSPIRDVQLYARSNHAAVLEYFWGDEKLFLIAIAPDELRFERLSGKDSLITGVQEYMRALRQPSWRERDLSFEQFFSSARGLYDLLLAPVLKDIDVEKLIIVRDGPLQLIPFESMLATGKNQETRDYRQLDYVLSHQTISYAHSADLLLKQASRLAPTSSDKNILAFSYSPSAGPAESPTATLNELPGAAREVLGISQVMVGTFLLGDDATEEKFKSLAGDYDILHLAVHGQADPALQFSGTLYFKPTTDGKEDGELHVHELYDLALRARLTVLSACESGMGKVFRGEGVFSIARGFAYAGCPATIMTLWPVSDFVSAQIMSGFYQRLTDGDAIDVALRRAKLDYLATADPQLAHPTYWAAYVPNGNMDPILPYALPFNTSWIIAAVAVGAAALFLLRLAKAGKARSTV